jgi:hypothetical protein
LKGECDAIIEQYELKTVVYREQMVEMDYLEDELAPEHEKYYRMEISYEDNKAQMK